MEKTKGESGDNLLILSEDDFAVSSGGLPINMIFKKKITEGFFEHFDGILIKFNDTLSVLKDFHPTSRSLRFMANEELELLDRCYQAYKEEESHLIYFYQKSVISEKMSQSHELKQRDLMFRSLNIANRPLNIVFPIQNIGENKT